MLIRVWKERDKYYYSIDNAKSVYATLDNIVSWYRNNEPFSFPSPWPWEKPEIADDVHVLIKLMV